MQKISILCPTVFFQMAAAILALRLVPLSGKATAWKLVSAALALMAVRPLLSLVRWNGGKLSFPPPYTDEILALSISILLTAGLLLIAPLFSSVRDSAEALQEEKERLRTLIDAMPDFVCFRDGEGRWMEVNRAGIDFFELQGVDYRGKKGDELARMSSAYESVFRNCLDTDEQAWAKGELSRSEESIPAGNGARRICEMIKVPLFYPDGRRKGLVVLGRDVTESKEAGDLLVRKSEEQALLLDNMETQVWYLKDVETYGGVNESHARFLGVEKAFMEERTIWEVANPSDGAMRVAANKEVFLRKEKTSGEEWMRNGAGDLRFLSVTRTPKLDERGEVEYVICAAQDITERKSAEEKVKRSLEEKDVLLKEIHHRVKNNLQIISSLLNLQSASIRSGELREVLRDGINRVKSIALVHEKLYQSGSLVQIDFNEYLRNVVHHLFRSYEIHENAIRAELHVEDASLSLDTVVSCGLIVNELVSNSIKHAFPGGRRGRVRIALAQENSRWVLRVSDNGVGLPGHLSIDGVDSLGLKLVMALVEEIKGALEFHSNGGLEFKIVLNDPICHKEVE